MNYNKYISGIIVFLVLFPVSIFSQGKGVILDETTRRKFDYFFYGAVNAKTQGKYDESFDLLQHCYAIDSTNASVLVELGAYYSSLDEKNRALDYFRKAVKYDPTNYYYNMILAGLSKELDLKDEVIDIYNYLLKTYPDKVELYFDLANVYGDHGELDKAIQSLDLLQKYTGVSDAITLNKFRLYNMMDKKERAFEEIQSVIDKNPDNIRYKLLMGDLYLQDNQTGKALEYYNQARLIDPDEPSLILSMVNYYEKTNNKTAAIEELQKAIVSSKMEVDTKLQLLARYIALLRQSQQDIKIANPLFQSMFEQHPNNTRINMMYGDVLLLQEDKKGAMEQFEIFTKDNPTDPAGYEQMLRIALPDTLALDKVIEITRAGIENIPTAPQFYFYMGLARFQQKKYNEALTVYEQGLANAEFQSPLIKSDFYGQIGDINHFLKNNEVAFENYEKALKLNPQNLPVLNNYSYYLSIERRDLDKAEQMSGITIKAEPTNPTYLDTYGWILFEQGAYTMAKIYIEKAIEYGKDDNSAEVLEHYGDVLAVTGDKEKAVEQWKKARELGSDSKTLNKKIRKKEYIKE
ncbi:Beta-barrel assembly-enhancing protease [bioreactor metagenome]|uniref:Beta-barrel assembly-enhancing protease n=1 Tax=bioreactor metagenome TaxID=1076179 RepID=A0A644Z919_9ZZZZ